MDARATASPTRKRIDRRCQYCKNPMRLVNTIAGTPTQFKATYQKSPFRKSFPVWVCVRCDKWGKLTTNAES